MNTKNLLPAMNGLLTVMLLLTGCASQPPAPTAISPPEVAAVTTTLVLPTTTPVPSTPTSIFPPTNWGTTTDE